MMLLSFMDSAACAFIKVVAPKGNKGGLRKGRWSSKSHRWGQQESLWQRLKQRRWLQRRRKNNRGLSSIMGYLTVKGRESGGTGITKISVGAMMA
jgi:hypothetical protein